MSTIDEAIANAEEMLELRRQMVVTTEKLVQALKVKKVWPAGVYPISLRLKERNRGIELATLVGQLGGEYVLTSHELKYLRPDLKIAKQYGV